MDSKIENYLLDVEEYLDTKTYNQMFADANKLDTKAWLNKYQASQQANDVLAATWNSYGFDTYSKDKYERYRDTFGSSDSENPFNKQESWLKAKWTSDYPDMSFEDFKNDIATMSKYWEDEKRAREYTAGKKRREKEVKEWPLWKNMLASDYAKQRYINEPNASIFGKEGKFNPYLKQGQEELSDLIYGVAGAIGDAIPSYGIVAGPAARAARDVHHKAVDSPYQKDWLDIAQDAATDAVVNASVDLLPNLRRYTNMAKRGSADSPISTVMKLEDDVKNIREQVDFIDNLFTGDNYVELIRQIEKLPESNFKTELQKYTVDPRHIDEYGIAETVAKWRDATDYMLDKDKSKIIDYARQDIDKKAKLVGADEVFENPLTQRMIFAPELTDKQKLAKTIIRGVETAAQKGGLALKEIDTFKGRGSAPNTDEDTLVKDWYKQNYARDWLLNKPFKPKKDPNDLKWQAYVELRKENNLEP